MKSRSSHVAPVIGHAISLVLVFVRLPCFLNQSQHRLERGCAWSSRLLDTASYGFPRFADDWLASGKVICCTLDGSAGTRENSGGDCLSGDYTTTSGVTYDVAKSMCKGMGMRLCANQTELDLTCSLGCGYDEALAWTSRQASFYYSLAIKIVSDQSDFHNDGAAWTNSNPNVYSSSGNRILEPYFQTGLIGVRVEMNEVGHDFMIDEADRTGSLQDLCTGFKTDQTMCDDTSSTKLQAYRFSTHPAPYDNLWGVIPSSDVENQYCTGTKTDHLTFNGKRIAKFRLGIHRDDEACCKTPTSADGIGLGSLASGQESDDGITTFYPASVYIMTHTTTLPQACDETGSLADYRGCQSTTVSGRTCQAWSSQSPHVHSHTPAAYPNNDLTSNYCRSPSSTEISGTIWCYTTDPDIRVEACETLEATDATQCSTSDVGGAWELVRRSTASQYPDTDQLEGTSDHGTPHHNPLGFGFARPFSKLEFDQMLFTTGDCSHWMIMDKNEVFGWYDPDTGKRTIVASHTSSVPYQAIMLRRIGRTEDPTIGFADTDGCNTLYEASGNTPNCADGPLGTRFQGLNVFIRKARRDGCRVDGTLEAELVPGQVVACNGAWTMDGIANGFNSCAPGWEICESMEALKGRGVTAPMCHMCPHSDVFFATLQSSDGNSMCDYSGGSNDVWGCGCGAVDGAGGTDPCNNFMDYIVSGSGWQSFLSSDTSQILTEKDYLRNTDTKFGGVMCCKSEAFQYAGCFYNPSPQHQFEVEHSASGASTKGDGKQSYVGCAWNAARDGVSWFALENPGVSNSEASCLYDTATDMTLLPFGHSHLSKLFDSDCAYKDTDDSLKVDSAGHRLGDAYKLAVYVQLKAAWGVNYMGVYCAGGPVEVNLFLKPPVSFVECKYICEQNPVCSAIETDKDGSCIIYSGTIVPGTAHAAKRCSIKACQLGFGLVGGSCQALSCVTGSVGTACTACVTQASRTSDTHCSACNPGYYVSSGSCQAWGCAKYTGINCAECVEQALRTSGAHCSDCNPGYFLNGASCQAVYTVYTHYARLNCYHGGFGAGDWYLEYPVGTGVSQCQAYCNSLPYGNQANQCALIVVRDNGQCYVKSGPVSIANCQTHGVDTYVRKAWGCTTGYGPACVSCVTQVERNSASHCASCNVGHYESSGICEAFVCPSNFILMTLQWSDTQSDNTETAASIEECATMCQTVQLSHGQILFETPEDITGLLAEEDLNLALSTAIGLESGVHVVNVSATMLSDKGGGNGIVEVYFDLASVGLDTDAGMSEFNSKSLSELQDRIQISLDSTVVGSYTVEVSWKYILHTGTDSCHVFSYRLSDGDCTIQFRKDWVLDQPQLPEVATCVFHEAETCTFSLTISRGFGFANFTVDVRGSLGDTFIAQGCSTSGCDSAGYCGSDCISGGYGGGINEIKNQQGVVVAYGTCCHEPNVVVYTSACQTSTSTTPATTTPATTTSQSTTTTLQSGLVECTLTLNVAKAEEFIEEPEIENVIRDALAALLDCAASWIQNIRIELVDSEERRLNLLPSPTLYQNGRRLVDVTTKGGVKIDFDVVIPPDGGPAEVTATLLVERFDQKSMEEASETVNKVVKSGLYGKDYEVKIVVKKGKVITERHVEAPAPAPEEDESSVAIMIALVAVGVALLLTAAIVVISCRRLKRNRKKDEALVALVDSMARRHEPAIFSETELLLPPEAISEEVTQKLLNFISDMLDRSNPIVFVCFALDRRASDAEFGGPGLFFSAAVVRALRECNIPCYCSLMGTEENIEEDRSLDFLSGKGASCKLVLIVDTRAIYRCRNCLEQIYNATTNNIEIISLQFEPDLPNGDERWRDNGIDDAAGSKMCEKVSKMLCSVNITPEPPDIVQFIPNFLETFTLDVERKLKSLDSFAAIKAAAPIEIGRTSKKTSVQIMPTNVLPRKAKSDNPKSFGRDESISEKKSEKKRAQSADTSTRKKESAVKRMSEGLKTFGKSITDGSRRDPRSKSSSSKTKSASEEATAKSLSLSMASAKSSGTSTSLVSTKSTGERSRDKMSSSRNDKKEKKKSKSDEGKYKSEDDEISESKEARRKDKLKTSSARSASVDGGSAVGRTLSASPRKGGSKEKRKPASMPPPESS